MTNEQTMQQKLFAFWKYDTFPFVLGGEIIKMNDKGRVSVKGYEGYWFNPIKIMPLEAGRILKEALVKLEQEYQEEQSKLYKVYKDKLIDLSSFIIQAL